MIYNAEYLDEQKEKINEVEHNLMSKYKNNSKTIYLIFEGQDDRTYYLSDIIKEIRNHFSIEWTYEIIIAGECRNNKNKRSCKKAIINCFKNIDWKIYDKKRFLFFIDRDFSDFLKEKLPHSTNFYITDGYSIENNVLNRTTFSRAIIECCNFKECSLDDRIKLEKIYDIQFKKFYNKMAEVCAWEIWWLKNKKSPQLGNIEIGELFKFKRGKISSIKKDITLYIHEKAEVKYDDEVNILPLFKVFKKKDIEKKYIRGKYLFEFFKLLCLSINEDYCNIGIKLQKNKKASPKLEFQDIANLTPKPISFYEFINNIW